MIQDSFLLASNVLLFLDKFTEINAEDSDMEPWVIILTIILIGFAISIISGLLIKKYFRHDFG